MYTGPSIILNDLSNPEQLSYIVTISQTIDSEFDIEKMCKNYPNDEYQKFKDCDNEYINQEVLKVGIMPFWSTKNISTATKFRSRLYNNQIDVYKLLIFLFFEILQWMEWTFI